MYHHCRAHTFICYLHEMNEFNLNGEVIFMCRYIHVNENIYNTLSHEAVSVTATYNVSEGYSCSNWLRYGRTNSCGSIPDLESTESPFQKRKKTQGHETDYSSSSSVELKNEGSYSSNPPLQLYGG